MEINGQDANEVWQKGYKLLTDESEENVFEQESRAGKTKELLHVLLRIDNPRQRWVTTRIPAINPAFALVEVIWIVCGRDDAGFLNHWNSRLSEFAGDGEAYPGAYGYRLRKKFGFDQLERAYLALKNNPESRQVVLQIWHPAVDLPLETGIPTSSDIPCNINSMLKIREGKLEWTQVMRSNDIILGLPHNLIQFTSLQEIIAGWLGLELGTYHHFSDSLHLYQHDIEQFHMQEQYESNKNNDVLAFSKIESDKIFLALSQIVDSIIHQSYSEKNLIQVIQQCQLQPAYYNWLCIIAAEEARRRGMSDATALFAEKISNPLLHSVWQNWTKRFIND